MSTARPPRPSRLPGALRPARAALALYPPAWRARYGDEVRALLEESGAGPRAVAGISAAGPILALRRFRPCGPAVTLAVRTAGYAAVTMSLAGAASIVAVLGLYRWAPAYHQSWQPGIYLPAVALAAAVAIVGATRGVRGVRGVRARRPPAA